MGVLLLLGGIEAWGVLEAWGVEGLRRSRCMGKPEKYCSPGAWGGVVSWRGIDTLRDLLRP